MHSRDRRVGVADRVDRRDCSQMSESALGSGCGASRASAGPGRPLRGSPRRLGADGTVRCAATTPGHPSRARETPRGLSRHMASTEGGPGCARPLEPAIRPSQHRASRGADAPTAPAALRAAEFFSPRGVRCLSPSPLPRRGPYFKSLHCVITCSPVRCSRWRGPLRMPPPRVSPAGPFG